jgi:hypothetical protein
MDLAALRRWWPFAIVAALLGLAALAAGHSSLEVGRVEAQVGSAVAPAQEDFSKPIEPTFSPQPEEEIAAAETSELPAWFVPLAAGLCSAVVLVIVGLVGWTLLRDVLRKRRQKVVFRDETRLPAAAAAQDVVAALDAGLVDLSDSDADPRRAVIACWLRLEQGAAAAGTPKEIGGNHTDLVSRLLQAHAVSADVLAALADVYREARYATHTVDDRMRVQSRSALQRIRTELTAEVATA